MDNKQKWILVISVFILSIGVFMIGLRRYVTTNRAFIGFDTWTGKESVSYIESKTKNIKTMSLQSAIVIPEDKNPFIDIMKEKK